MVSGAGRVMYNPSPGTGFSREGGGSPLYWSDVETCSYRVISMNVRPVSCMMNQYEQREINAAGSPPDNSCHDYSSGERAGGCFRWYAINGDAQDERISGKKEKSEFRFSLFVLSYSPSQRACSLTMAKASAGEFILVTFPSFMMEKDVPICSASHGSWVM